MRFHHGGRFTECPKRKYVDGEVTFVDMLDVDLFKMDLIYSVMNCIGYDANAITYFHYKIPLKGLDYALRPLSSDDDACKMLKYVHKHKTMYVFVEHDQTTIGTCGNLDNLDIVEEDDHVRQCDENGGVDLENEGADLENEGDDLENEDDESNQDDESNTDDEQDNENEDKVEEIVDEDHIVEEVDVSMKGFNFQVDDDGKAEPINPIVPHIHVDEEALEEVDFDSLDSDIGDDEQSERRKGVRKLKKAAGASGIKNNFFVGKEFPNRDEAKERIRAYSVECRRNLEFVKNDKERIRVRCIGVVPTINNKDSFLDKAKGKGKVVNTLAKEDKEHCPWFIYIGKGDKGKWVVKTFKDEHKCLQSRKIKAATSTFLSRHCQDLINMNPQIPVVAVQEHMQKKFHVGVSRTKAFRAKAKA